MNRRPPARTLRMRAQRIVGITCADVTTSPDLVNLDYNIRVGKYIFPGGHVATQNNDLHDLLIREFRAIRRAALRSAARDIEGAVKDAWTRERLVQWLRDRANKRIR